MSRATDRRPITLTTPSLGVRQWRDDGSKGETRIAWASAGGRGVPSRVILLPVVLKGERWQPPDGLMQELEREPGGFWDRLAAGLRLRRVVDRKLVDLIDEERGDDRDPAAPRATSVADDCGRAWNADHLVVLLVYDESPSGGEPEDVSEVQRLSQAKDEAVHHKETAAMKKFFEGDYDARLVTRGLVRLPPLHSAENPGKIVFALASCQYPADMTEGSPSDHGGSEPPASASLLRLSRLLTTKGSTPPPSLLVLAGDQVYIDATAGLFDARVTTDRFRLPYQNWMRNPGAQALFGLLPAAMVLDDHEIVDNWEPGIGAPSDVNNGVRAYRRFQRMAGPPLRNHGALWCEFTHAGVPFFLANTRTERHTPDYKPRGVGNWREARIMGKAQWDALEKFLLEAKKRSQVAFVVSPSMLLPRDLGLGREPSLALGCDDWDGYPASRDALLALLCDNDMTQVVFLSGDAHTSCVAQATVTCKDHSATLWSVHSSGLYCPYPFANGSPEDYEDRELFHFEQVGVNSGDPTRRYSCQIETKRWAPGDGFAVLTLTRSESHHALEVRFHRANDKVVPISLSIPV